ncbi:class I SAM-dependent methyltransferase [Chitinophaga caseinilytica]|uniref:Class I SAM-dependent methyltransferase n=1 Tax=Chitinophaga caseinilytica TaxID=2267521 RepID=A0ABZ2Z2I4_9BACT
MKQLSEKELIWSPVVANNRMNRKRNASGINSYEQELPFNPETFLDEQLAQRGHARWLDLCCGEGNALLQYARRQAASGQQERMLLHGVDLVDAFQPIPERITCLQLETGSLVSRPFTEQYDLVTCIHGLHYIGDKLQVLFSALKAIAPHGRFLANLDLKNIVMEGDPENRQLKQLFRANRIEYNARKHIIVCNGPREVTHPFSYLGANDAAGANYTGQEVVDSYYD